MQQLLRTLRRIPGGRHPPVLDGLGRSVRLYERPSPGSRKRTARRRSSPGPDRAPDSGHVRPSGIRDSRVDRCGVSPAHDGHTRCRPSSGGAAPTSAARCRSREFPGPCWLDGLDPATALSIREAGLETSEEDDESDSHLSLAVLAAVGLVTARGRLRRIHPRLGTSRQPRAEAPVVEGHGTGAQHLYGTVNRMEIVEPRPGSQPRSRRRHLQVHPRARRRSRR